MKSIKSQIIIFFVLSMLFSGCAVLNKYSITSSSIDLTKFEKQGIFVTTGDLSRKYETLSMLVINCRSGYKLKEERPNTTKITRDNNDDVYFSSSFENRKNYDYKPCMLEELFSELISNAKEVGANGIIKLELTFTQTGIEIVGLAVKIQDL